MEIVFLVKFLLFAFIQALFINGLKDSFSKDMIFDKPAEWISKKLGPWWSKPIVGCIKCMSSFWGGVTFWPTVLLLYGFQFWQLPVYVADVFILVYLNWFLYKRQ
jgi:hypothetical protein